MANFTVQNLPQTDYNNNDDFLVVNQLSSGFYESKRMKISNIPIELATDDVAGGVKIGFPEYEDKFKYPLSIDENGDGFFNIHWVDNIVISGEYKPELSAIQILVYGNPPYVITIDVKGLIDVYLGDEKTVEQRDNIFRLKDSAFLKNGNHAEYSEGVDGDVIFRRKQIDTETSGTKYQQILTKVANDSDIDSKENGRMYFSNASNSLFYKQDDKSIHKLSRPVE